MENISHSFPQSCIGVHDQYILVNQTENIFLGTWAANPYTHVFFIVWLKQSKCIVVNTLEHLRYRVMASANQE